MKVYIVTIERVGENDYSEETHVFSKEEKAKALYKKYIATARKEIHDDYKIGEDQEDVILEVGDEDTLNYYVCMEGWYDRYHTSVSIKEKEVED